MRVFGEKVTQVLRSQLIKRLEDHNLRLITNEFFNGLPTQPFDNRSARGIKAAVGYDSGNTILKLLQPVSVEPAQPQTEQQYRRWGSTMPV